MSRTFTHRLRVRFYECDPQGVVWNGNFLNYLDVAHTELMREARGPYSEVVEAGLEVVMAHAGLDFLGAARFDDELDIDLGFSRLGSTSLTLAMWVRREQDVLVTGEARYVYVDARSGEKTPIPESIRSALAPYVLERPGSDG